jgi:hypothetical protein
MLMRSALFWGITRRRVVIFCRRLGTSYRSHLQGSRVREEKNQQPLVLTPTKIGIWFYAQRDNDSKIWLWNGGGVIWVSWKWNTNRKKAPVPTLSLQSPRGVAWDRNRDCRGDRPENDCLIQNTRQQLPPKYCYTIAELHDVVTQKMTTWNLMGMRN